MGVAVLKRVCLRVASVSYQWPLGKDEEKEKCNALHLSRPCGFLRSHSFSVAAVSTCRGISDSAQ